MCAHMEGLQRLAWNTLSGGGGALWERRCSVTLCTSSVLSLNCVTAKLNTALTFQCSVLQNTADHCTHLRQCLEKLQRNASPPTCCRTWRRTPRTNPPSTLTGTLPPSVHCRCAFWCSLQCISSLSQLLLYKHCSRVLGSPCWCSLIHLLCLLSEL